MFWQIMGLERGTLSFVMITDELLERKGSCSGLERRDYLPWGPVALPTRHPFTSKSHTHYTPEDVILHSHHRENLKSYIALTGWTL
jgi:hypothetical protein